MDKIQVPAIRGKLEAEVIVPYKEILRPLAKGANLLFDFGKRLVLLKYEEHGFRILRHNEHTHNRHVTFVSMGCLFPPSEVKERRIVPKGKNVWRKAQGDIYGTHRLDFNYDEEFGVYLPSSSDRDLFLYLAGELDDGTIELRKDKVTISTGDELIAQKLEAITKPDYFREVVVPFLKNKPTKFRTPGWKRHFRPFDHRHMLRRYEKVARKLEHGAFVYIGCRQEVYLLGTTVDRNGKVYMQGTYTTSTKPLLYFSNNYLGSVSARSKEDDVVYISGFHGRPFVFPQIGRRQNCKNTVFTGEPDIITPDIDEALTHFATTDFAEFSDLVRRFAETIDFIHPAYEKNGECFY